MKTRTNLFAAGLLIGLLLPTLLQAQTKEAEQYKVDSALYVYYQRCKAAIASPDVLAMSDTLFQMAGEKGDLRMQAVALSTKLDYYYYRGQEDSIAAYAEQVKDFALHTNQPKYYYFAWGKRLIQFHIKQGKLNTALWEAQQMFDEARKKDDKEGLANCYNVLSTIYKVKGMGDKVLECRLKEAELIEQYGLDAYNLTMNYCDIAGQYITQKKMDLAKKALDKAEAAIHTSGHRVTWLQRELQYRIALGDEAGASACVQQMQELFDGDPALATNRKALYSAQFDYYRAIGDYPKALQALDQKEAAQRAIGEEGVLFLDSKARGTLYYSMGNTAAAARYLNDYIIAKDSVDTANEQNASIEFAALLDVERIRAERNELALQAKEDLLNYRWRVILLLAACLAAVSLFMVRVYRLNKKLKISEGMLRSRNASLVASEEMLSAAKERAERASSMKSTFIHNMTHEIRTPLNSIVGFSQLLCEMSDTEEARGYARMVEENNARLLKLVDDVLDLSDLDAGKILNTEETDLEYCCLESVKQTKPLVQQGVRMLFTNPGQPRCVLSNSQSIVRVLTNLLQNAAAATTRGSIILDYALSSDGRQLIFSVTDTGPGIPEEKRQEVFGRFTKANDFTQGSGLGLAISELLARKLGGSLQMDPQYTGGSRFLLTIPYETCKEGRPKE